MACWLVQQDGARVRVGARGVLLGRSFTSDVLLVDPRASALHAFVRLGRAGPEVVALGRTPLTVGGKRVERLAALQDGDRIEVAGSVLTVRLEDHNPPIWWFVQTSERCIVAVAHTGFVIGASDRADLQLGAFDPAMLTLHLAGQGLWVEPAVPHRIDGSDVAAGELVEVRGGSVVEAGETRLQILCERADSRDEGTHVTTGIGGAAGATLEFLPTGGRLSLDFGHQQAVVTLPELRCRLFAALLGPPDPYKPGEFVPDEVLLPLIWPRKPDKNHLDLNTLVHRVRKTLLKAGVSPTRVIERPRAGGVLRFCLAPGASAKVI